MKSYLIVKYKIVKTRLNELLRRYWAAYVVLLVMILYMGYVPNSPSKTEGSIVLIVLLSLTSLALFIRGTFKRATGVDGQPTIAHEGVR